MTYPHVSRSAVNSLIKSAGFDQMVMLKDIRSFSFCQHRLRPAFYAAHVRDPTTDRVVASSGPAQPGRG